MLIPCLILDPGLQIDLNLQSKRPLPNAIRRAKTPNSESLREQEVFPRSLMKHKLLTMHDRQ